MPLRHVVHDLTDTHELIDQPTRKWANAIADCMECQERWIATYCIDATDTDQTRLVCPHCGSPDTVRREAEEEDGHHA